MRFIITSFIVAAMYGLVIVMPPAMLNRILEVLNLLNATTD